MKASLHSRYPPRVRGFSLVATSSPKVRLGQPLDFAGLELFHAVQGVLITDKMRSGIKVLKERRHQFGPVKRTELGSFSDQFDNLRHRGAI